MKMSHLFFVAACLFLVATALGWWSDGGPTVKTWAGIAMGMSMLALGVQRREAGA